jgi:hypothetical protein
MQTEIERLKERIDDVPTAKRDFAASLVKWAEKRPLSDKQSYWVTKLLAMCDGTDPTPAPVAIGDMKGILGLFHAAQEHLKWPKIVLAWNDSNGFMQLVRLSVAGDRARVPGSVNVVEPVNKAWYGRIRVDGTFEPSMKQETPEQVTDLLKRFAADPVKVASEHGKLTGNCCFCHRTLEDERSTNVGYGPVCAKHFALPWGTTH